MSMAFNLNSVISPLVTILLPPPLNHTRTQRRPTPSPRPSQRLVRSNGRTNRAWVVFSIYLQKATPAHLHSSHQFHPPTNPPYHPSSAHGIALYPFLPRLWTIHVVIKSEANLKLFSYFFSPLLSSSHSRLPDDLRALQSLIARYKQTYALANKKHFIALSSDTFLLQKGSYRICSTHFSSGSHTADYPIREQPI
jgi:hypothetical protein